MSNAPSRRGYSACWLRARVWKPSRRCVSCAPQDVSLLLADELSEKLRLLDFEANFCLVKDIVPFPRTYFALPAANSRYGGVH